MVDGLTGSIVNGNGLVGVVVPGEGRIRPVGPLLKSFNAGVQGVQRVGQYVGPHAGGLWAGSWARRMLSAALLGAAQGPR